MKISIALLALLATAVIAAEAYGRNYGHPDRVPAGYIATSRDTPDSSDAGRMTDLHELLSGCAVLRHWSTEHDDDRHLLVRWVLSGIVVYYCREPGRI